MKISATSKLFATAAVAAVIFAGCSSNTADPQKKNWFEQTTDNTWNAVASPVSGIIPKAPPKNKPAVEESGVAEGPPEMVIMSRENRGLVTEESPKK